MQDFVKTVMAMTQIPSCRSFNRLSENVWEFSDTTTAGTLHFEDLDKPRAITSTSAKSLRKFGVSLLLMDKLITECRLLAKYNVLGSHGFV